MCPLCKKLCSVEELNMEMDRLFVLILFIRNLQSAICNGL